MCCDVTLWPWAGVISVYVRVDAAIVVINDAGNSDSETLRRCCVDIVSFIRYVANDLLKIYAELYYYMPFAFFSFYVVFLYIHPNVISDFKNCSMIFK